MSLNQKMTYDPFGRLTGVSESYSAGYTYDDIGNILTKAEGSDFVALTYGTAGDGSYHRPKQALINGDNLSITYDQIGNMTAEGDKIYEYDNENRLIRSQVPMVTVIPSLTPIPTLTPTLTPTPTPNIVEGDANGDGKVNDADYQIWKANYNLMLTGSGSGDFDNSGKVDGIDYSILRANWGTGVAVTPTTTPVPTVSLSPTLTIKPSPTITAIPTQTVSCTGMGGSCKLRCTIREQKVNYKCDNTGTICCILK